MQNESIPDARGPVFCGVDTHADSHWLYVLDWRGRKVLSRQFPADAAGYEALAGAIAAAGEPACIAMEGTSSYGAGLNPGRLRSEASFAAICGACPIPASSGKTVRHRLNRGGDRQANSALHEIARQRVMRDPETAEYAERARGRGKSDREVMRCLKRYVAREAYRALIGLATLMWTVPGGAQETGGPYMRDPRHPRHFTDEFKRQIVDLYNAGKPKREIMDEYDLGKSTVERWIKSINATGSPRAADNRTPEQNRILELERENRRLRMEVDVLKQAALIYARK